LEKSSINRKMSKSGLIFGSMVLAAMVLLPLAVKNAYVMHLFIMAYIGILLGMTFSMLFSAGLITLGAGAFYAIGAYGSTLLSTRLGLSFWAALPMSTLITGIVALAIGSIIVRHPGMAFTIITLLFAHVVIQATGQMEFFGGWGGIIGVETPDPLGPIQFATKTSFYYLILFLLLLTALVFHALYTSRIGRVWRSIKLSPPLAESLGINLYRYRLMAFVVASSAAGMVGSFYAHYFQMVTPEAFGGWLSIYIQLYAVLGGLEFYILGPAIGAVIMTFVPEYLRIAKEVEPIITGVFLLLIILFFSGGILGTLRRFWRAKRPVVFRVKSRHKLIAGPNVLRDE